ncbi:unnamed protein product [Polarella glacialis]|nr:unnamed protein product [Polarella glacialis]
MPEGRGSFLVMDFLRFIPFGPSIPEVVEKLGQSLALLHGSAVPLVTSSGAKSDWNQPYGFEGGLQTFLSAWPQDNSPESDFAEFFVQRRLRPQLEAASLKFQFRYGTSNEDSTALARLYTRVLKGAEEALEPVRHCKPSLLHGDLWTGNTGATQSRQPILVDPACWVGHAEFDLAVSQLFGKFPARFYDAYFEVAPKEPGFQERQNVYMLYHLLNQANLHGAGLGHGGTPENPGGYLEQAIAAMERLAKA